MNNLRPLILVSNDDGVTSKGICELIKFLRPLGELIVVAPDRPRSGVGMAMTSNRPVHCELVRRDVGLAVWRCSGTPTDCVKLGLHAIVPRKPDLVVAGINHGDNSSVNAHYSGTMAAVLEGCMKHIPSVAFSLCSHEPDANFDACGPYIRQITRLVLEHGLPLLTCLNVNFPDVPTLQGVRVCQQSKGIWKNEWEGHTHRDDPHHYWLVGEFEEADLDDERTDHWALHNGYVAITPTSADLTAYSLIDELRGWFAVEEQPNSMNPVH